MRVVELGRSDRRDYASTLSHIQAQDDTHAGTQTAITDGVTLTCDNDVIRHYRRLLHGRQLSERFPERVKSYETGGDLVSLASFG